ncbi:hypothetical protein CHR56_38915 (plasmid) [Rhizobium leguminosarum bv. viciae]|nr:hypothetical protein CHR56_38915 [Rhizobium leguminosarum bv. viciae]
MRVAISSTQRPRFPSVAVAAIDEAVGPDFPTIISVSQWKQQDSAARLCETSADAHLLLPLVDAG